MNTNIEVSYYKNIWDIQGDEFGHENIGTIDSLFECIRNGGKDGWIKQLIERIRQQEDKHERDKLKVYLPVVTWQGIFSSRENSGLLSLSSLICLDFDHLGDNERADFGSILMNIPFVVAAFLSPSGDGLKVIIRTDLSQPLYYVNCYRQLEEFFMARYGATPDPKCEPIGHGCFLSYDPNIYINDAAIEWHFEYNPAIDVERSNYSAIPYQEVQISDYDRFINKMEAMKNNLTDEQIIRILDLRFRRYKLNYTDGHRTKSIFVQASSLCKAGIEERYAIDYLSSTFLPTGYSAEKLLNEVNQAYKKNAHLFGSERGQYKSYKKYKYGREREQTASI